MSLDTSAEPSAGTSAHQVVIIGAGMSGLCMGIKLRERGITDFVILEKSPEVGGTWYDNTYPGACCDVASVLYSYSFAPNPDWSHKFSPHNEIKAYFQRCAQEFGLLPHLRLSTQVEHAQWQEDTGLWEIRLANGETLTARSVVSGLGQLNRPNIPDFAGRDSFTGHAFHSARWDHDYDLSGKRVAVIGNAASALQFIPHIAKEVEQLYVYQRSANYVIKRDDRAYKDWEKWVFRYVPFAQKAARAMVYFRGEWLFYPVLRNSSTWLLKQWEKWCKEYREEEIPDQELRDKLTPDYRLGCKRILISDDFYGAFVRDNVELVTSPITGMGEDSVRTEDGVDRPVDAVIYATGFKTSEMHSAVDFKGENGVSLQEAWRDGAEAYRGVCTHGFPNFFMLYGPNTNLGSNSIIFMVERQVDYVVNCIDKLLSHELRALDINQSVQMAYSERMQGELAQTVWVASCESWYKNAAGKVTNNWPRSTLAYWWHMRSPDFADFDMRV
ncbi:NAD(P)/FAD-dependent oxidoreductase [Congregibacter variabilis]|uniref:NAD(P)/FAD-dependent oxidoreductase n=1 Tax=Congregibacter variabilis TaxID=3081200 RepID=A0ABZ0HYW6_9GAMM|nr:NAD(P)/FAD-dependent oxidoreductase [Congregibacter sp. IMCC43200]